MSRLAAACAAAPGTPVTMVTAYDATMAGLVEESAVDMVLVGDSLGVAMLGYDRPDRVTVDEMVHHTAAVSRAVEETAVVADLPFGAYNESPEATVRSANRLRKEGGADAVKLEGGSEVAGMVAALDDAGIPAFGHLGLTPQTDTGADRRGGPAAGIVEDAGALDEAGAFGIVLKRVPESTAAAVTESVDALTVGIDAGARCDGQVLTIHDLLGLEDLVGGSAEGVAGEMGTGIVERLDHYHERVLDGGFPT